MKAKNKIEQLKKRVNQAFEIIQEMQKESFDNELNKIVEDYKAKKTPEYKKAGLAFSHENLTEKIQTPNENLTSIHFTFTNPKDFENGCVIDKNSFKSFVESKKKAEAFKEYADMWVSFKLKNRIKYFVKIDGEKFEINKPIGFSRNNIYELKRNTRKT